jgi:hypothetical protein
MILKQNSDEWDPIRDADKFEQKTKAMEEMRQRSRHQRMKSTTELHDKETA